MEAFWGKRRRFGVLWTGGVKLEIQYYREMTESYSKLRQCGILKNKKIFLFGHCNATEELVKCFAEGGFSITSILDNNTSKHGKVYQGIPIAPPNSILSENPEEVIVCIAARFYESMYSQLRKLGFPGEIRKMVDYNTYAEYSLSNETIGRKWKRIEKGQRLVAALFAHCPVEIIEQKELDAAIQAELYLQDDKAFIARQDRPYVVNLAKALYIKKIPLEKIYCCGVFGLPKGARAAGFYKCCRRGKTP